MPDAADPHDLARFVSAQAETYDQALSEIRAGRKRSHWMWFIFPQIEGLGTSPTARRYAIKSLDEARAYLDHPLLGPRLVACAEAALAIPGRTATEIFGTPDDMKLHSCATLFATLTPADSPFARILQTYYKNKPDPKTLQRIGGSSG